MIVLSIGLLFLSIIIITNVLGNFFVSLLKIRTSLSAELLGFFSWLGLLFIISRFFDLSTTSSSELFIWFLLATVVLFVFGVRTIKFTYNRFEWLFILIFVVVFVLLSMRYTLGEQMGDNVFLFNLVTKNIDTPLLNNFNYGTGLIHEEPVINTAKEYLTFYHLFSFILHYFYKLKSIVTEAYIPAYVLNMWVANLLFYYYSAVFLVSMNRLLSIKRNWIRLLIVLMSGLYFGTFYFNLTLPHFGITFLGLGISVMFFLMYEYWVKKNERYIILMMMIGFSMVSMGSTGLIVLSYLAFSFMSTLIIFKDKKAILYAILLLFPILIFTSQIEEIIKIPNFLLALAVIPMLLMVVHYITPVRNTVYKFILIILGLALVGFIFIQIKLIPEYWPTVKTFGEIKENFDRVRDFFSFYSLNISIRNIILYITLLGLCLKRETRFVGVMIIIMLLFFMNPWVYPLLYKYFRFLYHRAYFAVFNTFTLGLGVYALTTWIDERSMWIRRIGIIIMTSVLLGLSVGNALHYENQIYIPSSDFNPLYKLDNSKVDILNVLRREVEASEIVNAKVISQIYGTLLIAPDLYHYRFTVSDRRAWNPEKIDKYNSLYKIFFTPVFDGDDGPRFTANYNETCNLLYKAKVDFVLYDKRLHVFDEDDQNWIPIYRYARACGQIRYENDDYILFRYFY